MSNVLNDCYNGRGKVARTLGRMRSRAAVGSLIKFVDEELNPYTSDGYLALGDILQEHKDLMIDWPQLANYLPKIRQAQHTLLSSKREKYNNGKTNTSTQKFPKQTSAYDRPESSEKLLLEQLCDPNHLDKLDVIEELGELKSKKASRPIIDYLLGFVEEYSSDVAVACELCVEALCNIGGEDVLNFFREYISNPEFLHRDYIAFGLGIIGEPQDVDLLLNFFPEPAESKLPDYAYSGSTKEMRIMALGNIGNRKAIVALINDHPKCGAWLDSSDKCTNPGEVYDDAIRKIHQRLKPQGYNPALKRLAA